MSLGNYHDPSQQHRLTPQHSSDEKLDTIPVGRAMRSFQVSFSAESESYDPV